MGAAFAVVAILVMCSVLAFALSVVPLQTSSTSNATGVYEDGEQPVVVMVSFDAFRWDYLNAANTSHLHPNIDRLARGGVQQQLRSVYPTETFPNHYSIGMRSAGRINRSLLGLMISVMLGAQECVGVECRWYLACSAVLRSCVQ